MRSTAVERRRGAPSASPEPICRAKASCKIHEGISLPVDSKDMGRLASWVNVGARFPMDRLWSSSPHALGPSDPVPSCSEDTPVKTSRFPGPQSRASPLPGRGAQSGGSRMPVVSFTVMPRCRQGAAQRRPQGRRRRRQAHAPPPPVSEKVGLGLGECGGL